MAKQAACRLIRRAPAGELITSATSVHVCARSRCRRSRRLTSTTYRPSRAGAGRLVHR